MQYNYAVLFMTLYITWDLLLTHFSGQVKHPQNNKKIFRAFEVTLYSMRYALCCFLSNG
jgi:hypothetical protein